MSDRSNVILERKVRTLATFLVSKMVAGNARLEQSTRCEQKRARLKNRTPGVYHRDFHSNVKMKRLNPYLGARTKQMIGLTLSQDSVKSSSLDSNSNVENR